MKLGFLQVFEGAIGLWRENRDLLVRVAGVFIFLPLFAVKLFLVPPDVSKADLTLLDSVQIFSDWMSAHWPVIFANMLIQTFGAGVVFVMLLDPARPPLARAMQRALILLPLLIAAWLVAGVLTMAGLLLVLVPGFYLMGRTFLTGPALVAGKTANPFQAVANGITLTRGHGWTLLGVSLAVSLATSTVGGLFDGYDMTKGSPIIGAAMALAATAVATAGSIAMILAQVAAYRGLDAARQGI